MTLNINGVTVELPNDVQVHGSEDGKYIKITTKPGEGTVVEKVRVVVGPVQERIRVVERIVEVEKPCTRQHYPYYTWPYYPNYPWGTTSPNWNQITVDQTTCGGSTSQAENIQVGDCIIGGADLSTSSNSSGNFVGNLPHHNNSSIS